MKHRRKRKHRNPLPSPAALAKSAVVSLALIEFVRQLGVVDAVVEVGENVCPVCNGTGEIRVVAEA